MFKVDNIRDGASASGREASGWGSETRLELSSARTFLAVSFVCLLAGYIAMLAWCSPLTVQDLPNHLARACVMADLLFNHGAVFGDSFEYHFLFIPYVLGDLGLAALIELFNPNIAIAIWTELVFLSLPASLYVYLRASGMNAEYRGLLLIVSLYLATDGFFMMGFLNFRLGIAGVLIALAVVEWLRRRWSLPLYVLLIVVLIAVYLTHLAPIVFLGAAIGASGALRLYRRETSLGREVGVLIPIVGLLAWHYLGTPGYRQPHDNAAEQFFWGTPLTKLTGLTWDLHRLEFPWDRWVALLTVAGVLMATVTAWSRRALLDTPALQCWTLSAAFFAIYIAMPSSYLEASYVDVRASVLLIIFAMLGCARAAEIRSRLSIVLRATGGILVVLAVLCNLIYLGNRLHADSVWLSHYREVLRAIPQHSRVFPIYSDHRQGAVMPYFHVGSFVVTDRAGVIPSLFSGDRGDPMKYFRYVHAPYAPNGEWYVQGRSVDWSKVVSRNQYLVVMKPFDSERIPIGTTTVAENDAAAVLAIR
jgi:hypothetical protein